MTEHESRLVGKLSLHEREFLIGTIRTFHVRPTTYATGTVASIVVYTGVDKYSTVITFNGGSTLAGEVELVTV